MRSLETDDVGGMVGSRVGAPVVASGVGTGVSTGVGTGVVETVGAGVGICACTESASKTTVIRCRHGKDRMLGSRIIIYGVEFGFQVSCKV